MKKLMMAACLAVSALATAQYASAAGSNQENKSAIGVPEHGITNLADDENVREAVKQRAAEVSSSGMEADGGSKDSQYPTKNADTRTGPRGSGEKRQGTENSSNQGQSSGQGGSSGQGSSSNQGSTPSEGSSSNQGGSSSQGGSSNQASAPSEGSSSNQNDLSTQGYTPNESTNSSQ